jgi:hypothetical protein
MRQKRVALPHDNNNNYHYYYHTLSDVWLGLGGGWLVGVVGQAAWAQCGRVLSCVRGGEREDAQQQRQSVSTHCVGD